MAGVGTLIVRMMANTTNFTKGMSQARDQLVRTTEAAERMAQTVTVGLTAIGAAATVAGTKAVQAAAQWEMQSVAFDGLLRNTEKAHDTLSSLEKLSHSAAFKMPALALSARRMLALGWETENLLPDLKAVADAAAALGGGAEEVQRITRALGQMRAKGRVAAEEMNVQLAEIGIEPWRYLAEAIGVGIPEAIKKVERREITSDFGIRAILDGMRRDFGGSMERQSQTALGQWTIMLNKMSTITRGFGDYLIDALGLNTLMKGINKLIAPIAAEIANAKDAADAFRRILNQTFTPNVTAAIVAIGGAAGGIMAKGFLLAGGAALKAAAALVPFMLKGAAVAITAFTIYRNWQAIGGAMIAVTKTIVHAIAGAVGALGVFIPSLRGVSQSMTAWANNLGATAKSYGDAGLLAQELANRQGNVGKSAGEAAKAQKALEDQTENAAKAAGKNLMAFDQVHQIQENMSKAAGVDTAAFAIPDVAAAMAVPELKLPDMTQQLGVVDALAKSFDNVKASLERVSPVFSTVGYIISGVVVTKVALLIGKLYTLGKTAMANAIVFAKAWLLKKAGMVTAVGIMAGKIALLIGQYKLMAATALLKIGTVITSWGLMAKSAIASALIASGAWVMQMVAAIKAKIAMIPVFVLMIGKWVAMAIGATIAAIKLAAAWLIAIAPIALVIAAVVGVAALIITNWDRIKAWTIETWNSVTLFLNTAWQTISTTAINIWNAIVTAATTTWNTIRTAIETVVNTLVTTLAGHWTSIKTTAETIWRTIVTTAGTVWNSIRTAVTSRVSNTINAIQTMWENAKTSLKTMWQSIATTAGSIWDGIRNSIRSAINGIIGIINSFINGFNRIRIDIPAVNIPLVGKVGGFSIGMPQIPRIPMLEQGTNFVPRDMFAFLHKGEAVVPEKYNHESDDLANTLYQAIIDGFRMTVGKGQDSAKEVILEIDGARIGRVLLPSLIRDSHRTGVKLIAGV